MMVTTCMEMALKKFKKMRARWDIKKDGLKERFDEIIETINSRDSLLEEFDEEIFNALVEKIEILIPTHFIFELKSRMKWRK